MPHKTRVSQASQIESSAALERLEKSRLVSTFVPTNALVMTGLANFRVVGSEPIRRRGCGNLQRLILGSANRNRRFLTFGHGRPVAFYVSSHRQLFELI